MISAYLKSKIVTAALLFIGLIEASPSLIAAQATPRGNADSAQSTNNDNGLFSAIQFSKKFGMLFTSIHNLFGPTQKASKKEANKAPQQNLQLVVYNPYNQYYFQPRPEANNDSEKLITTSDILYMVVALVVMGSMYYICLKHIKKTEEEDDKLEEVFDKYLSITEHILITKDKILEEQNRRVENNHDYHEKYPAAFL